MALIFVTLAKRMQILFGFVVSGAGIFRRTKPSKADCFSVFHYLSRPALSLAVPANTCIPRLVPFTHPPVLEVCGVGNISQILNRVVGFVAVNVVNATARKNSMHIKPSKPVGGIQAPVNPKNNVPSVCLASRGVASLACANVYLTGKNSGFLVVLKKLAKSAGGKMRSIHAVVPYKQWFGQKPASVSAPVGFVILASINALGYQMLSEVHAGTRPMPATVGEALALLPAMEWPL